MMRRRTHPIPPFRRTMPNSAESGCGCMLRLDSPIFGRTRPTRNRRRCRMPRVHGGGVRIRWSRRIHGSDNCIYGVCQTTHIALGVHIDGYLAGCGRRNIMGVDRPMSCQCRIGNEQFECIAVGIRQYGLS